MENNTELIQAILISLECVKQYPKEKQLVGHPHGYLVETEKENKTLNVLENQLENLLLLNTTPEQYIKERESFIDTSDIDIKETLFEKCTSFKVLDDNKLVRSCISLLKYKEGLSKTPEVFVPKNVDDEFIGLDVIQE